MDAPPLTITTTQGTSQSTTRTGKDFYRELNYTNTSAAVSNTATITGTRSGPPVQTGTEQRPLFLPQTPESFDYDDDGNLTEDGRWIYTWDAENRLIAMETKTSIVTAFPGLKQRLEFAYDAQGRRIRKAVQSWDAAANNGTGDWVTVTDLRFVYDGWNLLTELDALNANAVVRSYAWGLDLSGSSQGAGGVGGLLWADTTTHSFAASADGNGNIVAWVNTASLAFAGRADYGAFGEPVMRTGMANALPFGFSSKYTDEETGLLYYGFRYYNSSTGRWLSRDPIGENGGINLYGFARNDGVNEWDYLGLWVLDLDANLAYAVATATEGSTWQNLADYRKLEAAEYHLWATHFSGAAVKSGEAVKIGCKYKIPNTLYLLQGDVSGLDYKAKGAEHATGFLGWWQNQGLAIKSAIARQRIRSHALSKKYKLVENLQAGSASFRSALQDPLVQAIYWHSHGDPTGVWGVNEEFFGPSDLGSPHHKLAELGVAACNSAGCASGWAGFVSSNGYLSLFEGLFRNPFSSGDDPR